MSTNGIVVPTDHAKEAEIQLRRAVLLNLEKDLDLRSLAHDTDHEVPSVGFVGTTLLKRLQVLVSLGQTSHQGILQSRNDCWGIVT